MSRRLNSHPIAAWILAAAATAAGIGFRAGVTGSVESPGPGQVDGIVVEATMETTELYIPPDSPIWDVAPALCRAYAAIVTAIAIAPATGLCEGDPTYEPPEVMSASYTLSVAGGRARLDVGGHSLLTKLSEDGAFGDFQALDPGTGRMMDSETFGATGGWSGLAEAAGSPELAALVGHLVSIRTHGEGPEYQGTDEFGAYEADRYSYEYWMSGGLPLPDGTETGVAIQVWGLARVAAVGPYASDPEVLGLFDQLGPRLVPRSLEGFEDAAELADLGIPLTTEEIVTIWAYRAVPIPGDIGGDAVKLLTSSHATEITDIRRETIDSAIFAALDEEKQACDCSCAGWEELKRFGQLSREEQERYPRLLAMVSCSRECMNRWTACLR